MVRDRELLDQLTALGSTSFSGRVFRATRQGLDPTTPSSGGGRWMLPDGMSILYTCLEKEGAMSELAYHLSGLTPHPSKPMMVHQLEIEAAKTLRITRSDFVNLGIDETRYEETNYARCQQIGDAAGFLGYDSLLVPSARWSCENLIVIHENHDINLTIERKDSTLFEWQAWARKRGYIR